MNHLVKLIFAWFFLLMFRANLVLAKKNDEAQKIDAEPLESTIKRMQEIEPGFIPKDERAVRLFLQQQAMQANESVLKEKIEDRKNAKTRLTKRINDGLTELTEIKSTALHAHSDRLIDDVIKRYEIALQFPHEADYSAHALYNLGRYYFEQDFKKYDDELAKYMEAKEQGKENALYPEENFNRIINTYETLLQKYPNFSNASVYYLLGLAHWYEGNVLSAIKRFEELIKKYPNDRLVDEVQFRLGEFYYDTDRYENALLLYAKVASNPSSPFFDKAIYKIAWAHFQLNHFNESIKNFIKVIELSDERADSQMATGRRAEAIRYVVKNFSEQLAAEENKAFNRQKKTPIINSDQFAVKLVQRIDNYFRGEEKTKYLRDILLATATQLLAEEKIEGAILALQKIIDLDPKHANNPQLESQIVEILQHAGRTDEALQRGYALFDNYDKSTAWYAAQKKNPQARKNARESMRDTLLSLAVEFHKSGKQKKELGKEGAQKDFLEAAELYRRYIYEFPERNDVQKAIFYFAEASFAMNRYRAALEAYALLKDFPLPVPDNLRRDASLNILFTFRHVLKDEVRQNRFKEIDFDKITSQQRGLLPEEIPVFGKQYLSSIDDFLRIAPNDERTPVLLFHAAAIYYVYGHHDDAMSKFYYIIDKYPKAKAASVAARLILDDAIAQEDFYKVAELSKQFAALELDDKAKDFMPLHYHARFKLARSMFEEALNLQKNDQNSDAKVKFKESAAGFAKLLADDPKGRYAEITLLNLAQATENAGTKISALPFYQQLYTQFPKSEYAKMARFQEALILEKMLKFSEAALAYDAIIKLYGKSRDAADATLNKALLYEAAGDFIKAASSYLEFARNFPEREEAPASLLAASALYKDMGNTERQIAILEQFVKRYRKANKKIAAAIEAHVQIADTYNELKKTASTVQAKRYEKLALENYRAAVALYSSKLNSPFAAYFAAKAKLFLEKSEQDAFKKMTISARTGTGQAQQMTAMIKKLSALSAKNEAIITTYAQPVFNAEALRRIGTLYKHLARTMVRAPCPNDVQMVDEFACDEYIILLEDKAAILEEKAVAAYKQAYEIALSSLDAPVDLVDNILAGLHRMRPGEYQRIGQLIERSKFGAVYGQGRMLSTGKMAYDLNPHEIDPDKPKAMESSSLQDGG